MMIRRHLLAVLSAVAVLFAVTFAASVAPVGAQGTTATLRVNPLTTGWEIIAENLTDDGAVAWSVYFIYDQTALATPPTFAVGSDWTDLACGFSGGFNPNPGNSTNPNGATIDGTCLQSIPNPGVTGTSVLGTFTFPAGVDCTDFPTGLTIGLDTGQADSGAVLTSVTGPDFEAYEVPDASMTDAVVCDPTAVTLGSIEATSGNSNLVFPALAAAAAMIIAGGLAFTRFRKR